VDPGYFRQAKWLHLTGCNLAVTESARQACYRAMACLPPGARLSFDANLRPELLTVEQIRGLCQPAIERADVLLPSLGEAAMLSGAADDESGCREWAAQGKIVALKMGASGCRIYAGSEIIDVPGIAVQEVDPTGAGDTFCAAFSAALLEGMSPREAGRFANAAGALAVTKLGPMEGAPSRDDVERLLAQR
jgi:sugar/nucleoside kinase (ribokinase family)